MADAARLHPDTHLTGAGRDQLPLGGTQTPVRGDLDCAIRGHQQLHVRKGECARNAHGPCGPTGRRPQPGVRQWNVCGHALDRGPAEQGAEGG
ncbi:hypothetical protein SHJG_0772 [Streptomyces hygroscopicus subsp. jinggangensis 5008]|nr:hypothetical protein SHJG_0772 [Streptomyces hygroscopicus subsp. jinggangensis 5008]AGF60271.1 hypothetical protein SHJGH_0605 [Streptomyces hygroscopicus subsp. jinggangensis TL01]